MYGIKKKKGYSALNSEQEIKRLFSHVQFVFALRTCERSARLVEKNCVRPPYNGVLRAKWEMKWHVVEGTASGHSMCSRTVTYRAHYV